MSSLSLFDPYSVRHIMRKRRPSNPCHHPKAQDSYPLLLLMKTALRQETEPGPSEEARPRQPQDHGPHSGYLGSLGTRQTSRFSRRDPEMHGYKGPGRPWPGSPGSCSPSKLQRPPSRDLVLLPTAATASENHHFGSHPFLGPVKGSILTEARPLCSMTRCPGPPSPVMPGWGRGWGWP